MNTFMKILFSVSVLFLFDSCQTRTISISGLNSDTLSYGELPLMVQDAIIHNKKHERIAKHINVIILDSKENYDYKIVKTGPFISYKKLIDIENGIQYRIPTETPFPYVVLKNKLYIPHEYNVGNSEKALTSLYTCYYLLGDNKK
jgi:hypothetical protein